MAPSSPPPPPGAPPSGGPPRAGATAPPPVSGQYAVSSTPTFEEYDDRTSPGTPLPPAAMPATPYVTRSRVYAFVVDDQGLPIELGSGRFAKAYLGEERWVESKTTLRRPIAIKVMQKGVSAEDQMRFQMEKEILERVQGHPNIIELLGSGEGDSAGFIPPAIRDKVENDFMDPLFDPAGTYTYSVFGVAPCTFATATVDVTVNTPPQTGNIVPTTV